MNFSTAGDAGKETKMEVIPGSVTENGNGAKPPKGGGKRAKGEKARGAAKGRRGEDKTPEVTKPKVIADRIDQLVALHVAAVSATTESKEAITKAAEDSGYNASTVRKLVIARAGEKFEETKRLVAQQFELFEEVGEK